MNVTGFTSALNEICEWLMKLAFINTLWLLFTIGGLGVFGWAPATAALFAVLRNQFMSKGDARAFKLFLAVYRKEFIKANLIGLFIVVGAFSLYASIQTLPYLHQYGVILLGTIFIIFSVLFLVLCLFIFPVFSHYDTSLLNCFRYALLLGISHLHYCLLMIVGIVITYILFHSFPGLLLFYAISLPSACIIIIALNAFRTLEKKENALTIVN